MYKRHGEDVVEHLYVLSDLTILFFFVAATCIYSLLLYNVLRFTVGRLRLPTDSYFGITIIGTLVSISAILLAFTLIQAIGTTQKIDNQIANEVTIMELLDEKLLILKIDSVGKIRAGLLAYVRSVVEDEWKTMAALEDYPKTQKLYDDILHEVYAVKPNNSLEGEVLSEIRSILDDLTKARYMRLSLAGKNMPKIFWVGIMFLFTVNIVQFFFLTNRSNYSSFILTLHMSSLGILLGLVFIYDHPFIGESRIKSDSFVKVLHRMEARYP